MNRSEHPLASQLNYASIVLIAWAASANVTKTVTSKTKCSCLRLQKDEAVEEERSAENEEKKANLNMWPIGSQRPKLRLFVCTALARCIDTRSTWASVELSTPNDNSVSCLCLLCSVSVYAAEMMTLHALPRYARLRRIDKERKKHRPEQKITTNSAAYVWVWNGFYVTNSCINKTLFFFAFSLLRDAGWWCGESSLPLFLRNRNG